MLHRVITRLARRFATLAILLAAVRAAHAQRPAAAGTGAIVAIMSASETGAPLSFGIASIRAIAVEKLANDRGIAVLSSIPAGAYDLYVRHLGYTPRTVRVIVRASSTDTVRVALTKLSVQLAAVEVNAKRACTNPGPPSASTDPAFAAVVDQLEQNADQYRLLAATYPFTYDMERRQAIRYVAGDEVVSRFDTIRVNTGVKWHYAPGDLIERADDPRNRQVVINIPALIHFAEPSFMANHCFFYGGRETLDGAPALRVDFIAASRIKAPDVDGTMYLDPATFQLRRSVLHLTKIPDETPEIRTISVTTDFTTVVPSIAIASLISSIHRLKSDSTRPLLPFVASETQKLVRVTFLDKRP